MQRLPLKMWLKNVAAGCGSITQRIKNGLHFYFILAFCFSFFFMFMIPTLASDTPDITPPSSDKPYYAIFKRYTGTHSNYYSVIVYSDVPLDYGATIIDNRTGKLKFYSKDNSTFLIYQAYYDGNTLGAVQDLGVYSSGSFHSFDPSVANGFIFTGANYDIYVNGDLVFQKPGEEVVPEELWIALYNLIAQNALVIVAIVGVSLIVLWISLRLLVRCFRIFLTPSKNSRR